MYYKIKRDYGGDFGDNGVQSLATLGQSGLFASNLQI